MSSFMCDECDGLIGEYEDFIQFMGMNYCERCFEEHKHDLDLDEEGTVLVCDCCGEEITSGYYYRFDDEIFCMDCVDSNARNTTVSEIMEGRRADRRYEQSF